MRPHDLALQQLDAVLSRVKDVPEVPRHGWIKAIRTALGMTARQLAARVGIAQPTLTDAEKAEAEGRITLGQLRRIGAAMDCELRYALIPRVPLYERVHAQALAKARKEVEAVAHTMSLEAQEPGADFLASQIREVAADLLNKRRSRLWD